MITPVTVNCKLNEKKNFNSNCVDYYYYYYYYYYFTSISILVYQCTKSIKVLNVQSETKSVVATTIDNYIEWWWLKSVFFSLSLSHFFFFFLLFTVVNSNHNLTKEKIKKTSFTLKTKKKHNWFSCNTEPLCMCNSFWSKE